MISGLSLITTTPDVSLSALRSRQSGVGVLREGHELNAGFPQGRSSQDGEAGQFSRNHLQEHTRYGKCTTQRNLPVRDLNGR